MTERRPRTGPRTGRGPGRSGSSSARPASRASAKGRPAPRPRHRVVVGLLVSVVLVGFLLVGVFPTRAWLAQRDELSARHEELDALEAEQDDIQSQVDRLQTPEEIERIAREEYGMTRRDETAFRMLPGAVAPVDLPDTWPFTGADDWLNR